MKNQILFHKLFLSVMLVGLTHLLISVGFAQGDEESFSFNPYDTCHQSYFENEYVFIGVVKDYVKKNGSQTNKTILTGEITVHIEDLIKGNLRESVVFTPKADSWSQYPRIGKKYIFTVRKKKRKDNQNYSLISLDWSNSLDKLPKSDLTNIISNVKELQRGTKQVQVIGNVVQHGTNPVGLFRFNKTASTKKLGYNPDFATPLSEIEVIVKSENNIEYKTLTDEYGNFLFNNLPVGKYNIQPVLSRSYLVRTASKDFTKSVDYWGNFYISKSPCSVIARFMVAPAGELEAEVLIDSSTSKDKPYVFLQAVNSSNSDIYKEFVIPITKINFSASSNKISFVAKDLPVGEYVVKLYFPSSQKTIYLPKLDNNKVTDTVHIKVGEKVRVKLSNTK